ncbi:MAG: HlyD family secretion protein [Hyphomicrobiaceae bacterium]
MSVSTMARHFRDTSRFPTLQLPTLRFALLVIVPALIAIIGGYFYMISGRYVSTDNAYIGAEKVLITPDVSGKVVRIAVVEGQKLKPGDELFEIDPVPYRLAVKEAQAKVAQVTTDLQNLKDNLASLGRQIVLSRDSVAAAQADFDRKTTLARDRYTAATDLDKSRSALLAAKAQLETLQQQETSTRNQLLGDANLALDKYPAYQQALAALDRAQRDLTNTVLRAPIAGIATQVSSIQMGRYLTAGTPVFSMIGSESIWIDANPKETDLTHVRVGQPVSITVDAFPSREWKGTVAAISPGTGAQFSILPPQNAAGNWVKVVQRVPVRITFMPGENVDNLRSGMSVTVDIDTGRRSRLTSLFGSTAEAEDRHE